MTDASDPLDALRLADVPVAPRPELAAELRARVARALGIDPDPTSDEGAAAMTTTEPTATAASGVPPGEPALSPYLAVHDARAAIRFYGEAFGAELVGPAYVAEDGRIGHAQLRIGPAVIMLADPWDIPGIGDPTVLGGTSVQLHLYVPDVDETFARAMAAGATSDRPPADEAYGDRAAVVVDPFGHHWMLATNRQVLSTDELRENLAGSPFRLEDLPDVDLGKRD